jgi:hypothetical protein
LLLWPNHRDGWKRFALAPSIEDPVKRMTKADKKAIVDAVFAPLA